MTDDIRCITCSSEQKSEHCQLQRKKLPPEGGGAVNNKHCPGSSATSIKKPTTLTVIQKKILHQTLLLMTLIMRHQKISLYPLHQTQPFQQYLLYLKKTPTTHFP